MSFHLGQRIICIDDSPGDVKRLSQYRLEKGKTYTVYAIGPNGMPIIQVSEVPVPKDCYWRANRFLPLHETSIEIFKAMLVSPQVTA